MEHQVGDVLQAPGDFVIAHCISANLRLGKGIARTIQDRYRELIRWEDHSVGCAVVTCTKGRLIYHLVTKNHHLDSPREVDIAASLWTLRGHMHKYGERKLAIPELACGLDGQSLKTVSKIVENVFDKSGIEVVMYHLDPNWRRRI